MPRGEEPVRAPDYGESMNAAQELAELLVSWQQSQSAAWETRVAVAQGHDTLTAWRTHARAGGLLREVDRALESMRDANMPTEAFDPWVEAWHAAVFAYPAGWNERSNAPAIDPAPLSSLQALGLVLDLNALPPVDEARRETLLAALRDAEVLLGQEQDHLTASEQEYVWRLLNGARDFVMEQRVRGEADLREHLDRLSGALLGMAARLGESGEQALGQRFAAVALTIAAKARTVVYDAAALATIAAAVSPVVLAVTGGGK